MPHIIERGICKHLAIISPRDWMVIPSDSREKQMNGHFPQGVGSFVPLETGIHFTFLDIQVLPKKNDE